MPWVTGPEAVNTVANFQRACGLRPDGTASNKFLYYYFKISSAAGEEIYSLMPLLFWVSFPVGLSFLTNFLVLQLAGQLTKEFFMLPRPRTADYPACKNPIVKLDRSYDTEYGLPSTHTIAGMLPTVVMLILQRHGVPVEPQAWVGGAVYFLSVALSRLYLGVHSVYDLLAGALLGVSGILFLHLCGDSIDVVLYQHETYAVPLQALCLFLFLFAYPRRGPWSVSWGTSAQIMGPFVGLAGAMWYMFNVDRGLLDVLLQASLIAPRPHLLHTHSEPLSLASPMSFVSYCVQVEPGTHWRNDGPASFWSLSWQTVALRLLVSFALMGLTKVLSKALPNMLLCWASQRGLLASVPKQQECDCFGNIVPIHKRYSVEVTTRMINYAFSGVVCVAVCPVVWLLLPQLPSA